MRPLFRYPGGKAKLARYILPKLKQLAENSGCTWFCDPFTGGGAIALGYLGTAPPNQYVWLNDADNGISCIWDTILNHPHDLKLWVQHYQPAVADFETFRYELDATPVLLTESDCLNIACKKLALHQISYSGLGAMAGGPIGGKSQTSAYKVGCRWRPDQICRKIDAMHALLAQHRVVVSCTDFSHFLTDDLAGVTYYIDPPYYQKGEALYKHSFSMDDHQRLATQLHQMKQPWLLSYDDCPEVRALYSWAQIETVDVGYSICGQTRKRELLVSR